MGHLSCGHTASRHDSDDRASPPPQQSLSVHHSRHVPLWTPAVPWPPALTVPSRSCTTRFWQPAVLPGSPARRIHHSLLVVPALAADAGALAVLDTALGLRNGYHRCWSPLLSTRPAVPTEFQEFGRTASVGIASRTSPVLCLRPRVKNLRVPLRSHPCGERGMKNRGRRGLIFPASSWVVITDSQIYSVLAIVQARRHPTCSHHAPPPTPAHPRQPRPPTLAHPNRPPPILAPPAYPPPPFPTGGRRPPPPTSASLATQSPPTAPAHPVHIGSSDPTNAPARPPGSL